MDNFSLMGEVDERKDFDRWWRLKSSLNHYFIFFTFYFRSNGERVPYGTFLFVRVFFDIY